MMGLDLSQVPSAWRLPFTVADEGQIEALDEDTRAVVERYVVARFGGEPPKAGEITGTELKAYQQGWQDAADEMEMSINRSPPAKPWWRA